MSKCLHGPLPRNGVVEKESTFVRDLNLKPPPLGGRAEG